MDETTARQVLLLKSFETAAADHPLWSAEDRRWATRVALEETPPGSAPAAFIARRAHAALQRLGPREPHVAAWLAHRLWHGRWALAALGLGAVLGLVADAIGPAHRVDLLAPPAWALVLWNLVVCTALVLGGLWRLVRRRPASTGGLRGWLARRTLDLRSLARLTRGDRKPPADAPGAPSLATLLGTVADDWTGASAPLAGARAAVLLHLGAIGLALGLIGGLYLRGLVLDYRAAWSSTFLDAPAVHALLTTVLQPAARLAGFVLPDAASLAVLQVTTGPGVATPYNGAANWIHLIALTLVLAVVLPRLLLAGAGSVRALWLARRFPVDLEAPYFQELLRQQRQAPARLTLLPYAQPADAAAADALAAWFRPLLGERLTLQVEPVRAYGVDDEVGLQRALGGEPTLLLALFDLAATPEAEVQARWLRQMQTATAHLRPPPRFLVLVEEDAFVQRFGATAPERIAQRRQAWRELAQGLGLGVLPLRRGVPVDGDDDAQAVRRQFAGAAP
jgi:hypothetical protein